MPWSLLVGASWTFVVVVLAIVLGNAMSKWFLLRRYQIGQQSETDRFARALKGSKPQQRPAIIKAYSSLARNLGEPDPGEPSEQAQGLMSGSTTPPESTK